MKSTNRRIERATSRKQWVRASYYYAEHLIRLGKATMRHVESFRQPVNFSGKFMSN